MIRALITVVFAAVLQLSNYGAEAQASPAPSALGLRVAALMLNYSDYSPNGKYMLELSNDSVTWLRLKGPFTPTSGVGDPYQLLSTNVPMFRLRAVGASALALVSKGSISQMFLTDGGGGYSEPPAVTISGGGGSGAVVTAQISGGAVVGFTIVNGGTGYTTFPTVQIAAPDVLPGRVETSILLFEAVMTVEPDVRYQLEGTTNYVDWSSFGTFQATTSIHKLFVSPADPIRVLRVKQLP